MVYIPYESSKHTLYSPLSTSAHHYHLYPPLPTTIDLSSPLELRSYIHRTHQNHNCPLCQRGLNEPEEATFIESLETRMLRAPQSLLQFEANEKEQEACVAGLREMEAVWMRCQHVQAEVEASEASVRQLEEKVEALVDEVGQPDANT